MKILITGGTGLVGRNLIKRLNVDSSVVVVARTLSNLIKLKNEFPKINIISGDIGDEKFVKRIVKDIDVLYHLAALRAVGIAEENVEDCISTNIIGTIHLINHFDGDRFVTLSTDKAVQIRSVYGATKFLVERLILEHATNYITGVRYCIVRCGNIFGSTDSVISIWRQKLLDKTPIDVTCLNATRFFCTADHVIDSMLLQDDKCRKLIRILDLKSLKLSNLLKAMQIKYGKAIKINVIGKQKAENIHELMRSDGKFSNKVKQYTIKEILKLI